MHQCADSDRDQQGSIPNSTIESAQSVRFRTRPFAAARSLLPPSRLLPWCFRDHGSDFPASFEFRQLLGSAYFFRHLPATHLT
ncbi:hypothetical protein HNP71_002247 [Acidocella aromatica]|uniref:Uncharacterized protein n=1 Tax=Acidocella aromatica TaxID=1303579 RepID=A0A840VRK0_9PROT|nr:hypothetical protein [Acidocella aromatica]